MQQLSTYLSFACQWRLPCLTISRACQGTHTHMLAHTPHVCRWRMCAYLCGYRSYVRATHTHTYENTCMINACMHAYIHTSLHACIHIVSVSFYPSPPRSHSHNHARLHTKVCSELARPRGVIMGPSRLWLGAGCCPGVARSVSVGSWCVGTAAGSNVFTHFCAAPLVAASSGAQ